jgi:hypothetical protein
MKEEPNNNKMLNKVQNVFFPNTILLCKVFLTLLAEPIESIKAIGMVNNEAQEMTRFIAGIVERNNNKMKISNLDKGRFFRISKI